jgi:hypothetical protein
MEFSITEFNTLIIVLIIAGFFGASRGPYREIWTLGCMTLIALIYYGVYDGKGKDLLSHFPARILASIQLLGGDQAGSNETLAGSASWPTGLTQFFLIGGTAALIFLSYTIGNHFGKEPNKTFIFGEWFSAFVMGAFNGLIIASFVLGELSLRDIRFDIPSNGTARNAILPLIILGIIIALIALFIRDKDKKAA